jgi:hypothetical protein
MSIISIRSELARATRHLSDIRKDIESSTKDYGQIHREIGDILSGLEERDRLLSEIESAGGVHEALKRLSRFLIERHGKYSECLRIIDAAEENQDSLLQVVKGINETRPEDDAQPDEVYAVVCLAGLVGLFISAAVVVTVLVVATDTLDDGTLPDKEDVGDEDPGGGICYPEDGLDVVEGVCR